MEPKEYIHHDIDERNPPYHTTKIPKNRNMPSRVCTTHDLKKIKFFSKVLKLFKSCAVCKSKTWPWTAMVKCKGCKTVGHRRCLRNGETLSRGGDDDDEANNNNVDDNDVDDKDMEEEEDVEDSSSEGVRIRGAFVPPPGPSVLSSTSLTPSYDSPPDTRKIIYVTNETMLVVQKTADDGRTDEFHAVVMTEHTATVTWTGRLNVTQTYTTVSYETVFVWIIVYQFDDGATGVLSSASTIAAVATAHLADDEEEEDVEDSSSEGARIRGTFVSPPGPSVLPSTSLAPSYDSPPDITVNRRPYVTNNARKTVEKRQNSNQETLNMARSILDTLDENNLSWMAQNMIEMKIKSKTVLENIMELIHQKALSQPKLIVVLAEMCAMMIGSHQLSITLQHLDVTVLQVLLPKCYDVIYSHRQPNNMLSKNKITTTQYTSSSEQNARLLANSVFIAELYNRGVLPELILWSFVVDLARNDNNAQVHCLATILKSAGSRLSKTYSLASMVGHLLLFENDAKNEEVMCFDLRQLIYDVKKLHAKFWIHEEPSRAVKERVRRANANLKRSSKSHSVKEYAFTLMGHRRG